MHKYLVQIVVVVFAVVALCWLYNAIQPTHKGVGNLNGAFGTQKK